jgi:4-nitrophenyl phosphatase
VGEHHDEGPGLSRGVPRDLESPWSDSVEDVETIICDLDGVVWLEGEPIGGSVAAVRAWRSMGCRVLFVTNNSTLPSADHAARLSAVGIEAAGDVVSSSDAVASLIAVGESVMVLGGPGLVGAVEAAGARVINPDAVEPQVAVDTVVVGLDRRFNYPRLAAAVTALEDGARFVASNDDPYLPTPTGPMPGAGSMVAAVATASGRSPLIAGKPHAPIIATIHERLGPMFDPARAVVVGDRLMTDGVLAARLGCRFALVGDDGSLPSRRGTDDDARDGKTHGDDRAKVVDVDVVDEFIHDPTRVSIWFAADTLHDVMVACRERASD